MPWIPSLPAKLMIQDAPGVVRESEELIVHWKHQRVDTVNQVVHFWGGVEAEFGPSTIICEELVVDRKNKRGHTVGTVTIKDPEGTITGSNLQFDYAAKTGSIENVHIEMEDLRLEAALLEIDQTKSGRQRWTILNLRATPSKRKKPDLLISSSKLSLIPGASGRANQLGIELFGAKIPKIPYLTFSLDNRAEGFQLPAIAFKRGKGIGFSWGGGFLVGGNSTLTTKLNVLPKSLPLTSVEFSRGLLGPEKFQGRLFPRSDLDDRFSEGYMDNILVENPAQEEEFFNRSRALLTLGTYHNFATRGREVDSEQVSKDLEIAYEVGMPGYLAQVRLHQIRPDNASPKISRAETNVIAHSGMKPLGDHLFGFGRLDLAAYSGAGKSYAWGRAQTGLIYQPNTLVSLGVSYAKFGDSGERHFEFDTPYIKDSLNGRVDFDFGSIFASALAKYDLDRKRWSDVEYGFSFLAGSFEPYFRFRRVPRELQFGVRLRAADLFERLSQRRVTRKPEEPPEGGPKTENSDAWP